MKLKFSDLNNIPMNPVSNDEDGLINEITPKYNGFELAIVILGETGRSGYDRIWEQLPSNISMPSYYHATKDRPIVKPIKIKVNPTVTSTKNSQSEEDIVDDDLLSVSQEDPDFIQGAKIDGNYCTRIGLLKKKHRRREVHWKRR